MFESVYIIYTTFASKGSGRRQRHASIHQKYSRGTIARLALRGETWVKQWSWRCKENDLCEMVILMSGKNISKNLKVNVIYEVGRGRYDKVITRAETSVQRCRYVRALCRSMILVTVGLMFYRHPIVAMLAQSNEGRLLLSRFSTKSYTPKRSRRR